MFSILITPFFLFKCLAYARRYYEVQNKYPTPQQLGGDETRWKKPAVGWVKINVDAAVGGNGGGSWAAIARNAAGEIIGTKMEHRETIWGVQAMEAATVRLSFKLGHDLGLLHLELETDCQPIFNALTLGKQVEAEARFITADCLELVKSFKLVKFSFTKRDGNKCAHSLARFALNNSLWVLVRCLSTNVSRFGWTGC